MHTRVVLLMLAENVAMAQLRTTDFMEAYGDDKVWDWYVIGGRWSGALSQYSQGFEDKAKELVESKDGDYFQSDIDAKQTELQALWESLGATGPNPWANHYNIPKSGGVYDVMPLTSCLIQVKQWQQNPTEAGQVELNSAKDWLDAAKYPDMSERGRLSMYGYSLRKAGNLFASAFCFDCNVFNIDSDDYSLPGDIKGWYAVIVDMHT